MKSKFLIIACLMLLFSSCSKYFLSDNYFKKKIDIPSSIQRLFLNNSTIHIIKNNLYNDIKNQLLSDDSDLNEQVYQELIIFEIIENLRTKFCKNSLIEEDEKLFFKDSGFTYFFDYDKKNNKPVITGIIYDGEENLYNYIFNNSDVILYYKDIEKVLTNYFITTTPFFENILSQYHSLTEEILFGNIEKRLGNIIIEKDFNLFLYDFFILSKYYIHTFQLEKFYQFLKLNFDEFIYKDYVKIFLENKHKISLYHGKDNFDKLKLYYFYNKKNEKIFNIYYIDFFKKYSNSLNSDIIVLLKYDLYKSVNFSIDMKSFNQLIHFYSGYVNTEYYYTELLYSNIAFNKTREDLSSVKKIISNLPNKIQTGDFVKYFDAYILHNNRNWAEAIVSYRELYSDIILARRWNNIRLLLEEIIKNQIFNDDYVRLPSLEFDIIKTLDGMLIKEVFDNENVKSGDILISINDRTINDYIQFLTVLNSYPVWAETIVQVLRGNKIMSFESKISDYVKK